jgi:outer membrane protein
MLLLGVVWTAVSYMDQAVAADTVPKSLQGKRAHKKDLTPAKPKTLSMEHPFYKALIQTYNTNPTLQGKARDQYANAENVAQALSGWRPSLNLSHTARRGGQETQVTQFDTLNRPIGPRQYSTTYQTALNLTQNLYAGGGTVAAIGGQRASLGANIADFTITEQSTLSSAVQAYIDLCYKRSLLDLKQKNVVVKKKTLDQAKARMEVGELTLTDVSQAESEYASAQSDEISARADVETAKETYHQVVGEIPAPSLPLPDPVTLFIPIPNQQDVFVNEAVKNNPQIIQAKLSYEAAKYGIDSNKAALLPSVGLTGSLERNVTSDTVNNARSARNNAASIGVTVSVPLYGNGGSDWSKFRQARQAATSRKIAITTTERSVRQAAVSAWESWTSTRDQITHLETQVEAAKISLEGVRQESLVGERTLLDVLNAEDALLQAETNLIQAKTNFLIAGFQMLLSLGQLTAAGLGLPVEYYPVKEYAKDVEGMWIGTGYEPKK